GGDVEDHDRARPCAADEMSAVGREGDAVDPVALVFEAVNQAAVGPPQFHQAVRTAGCEALVGGGGETEHDARVRVPLADLPALVPFPQPHGAIRTGACEGLAIRTE